MPKYEVTVRETWTGSVVVEAENEDDAVDIVNDTMDVVTQYYQTEEMYANEIDPTTKSSCKLKRR